MAAPVYRWRLERAVWLRPGDLLDLGDGLFARVASADARANDPEALCVMPDVVALEFVGAHPDALLDANDQVKFLRPDAPPIEEPADG